MTTGLERAAGAATQRPAAPCAVFERSRPRSTRREHPSRLRPERDRSAANAGAASALCVQLREAVEARRNPCRQPAESSGAGGLAASVTAGGPPASLGAAAWVGRARPRGGGRAKGLGFKMARRAGRLCFCLPPPGTQGYRRLAQPGPQGGRLLISSRRGLGRAAHA